MNVAPEKAVVLPSWMHERRDTHLGDEWLPDDRADDLSRAYERDHSRRAEDTDD